MAPGTVQVVWNTAMSVADGRGTVGCQASKSGTHDAAASAETVKGFAAGTIVASTRSDPAGRSHHGRSTRGDTHRLVKPTRAATAMNPMSRSQCGPPPSRGV